MTNLSRIEENKMVQIKAQYEQNKLEQNRTESKQAQWNRRIE